MLVILGLLVGGILSGKSLIRASEIRAVVREHEQFRLGALAFRDKYFMLPGDMNNATQFWGAAAAPGAACAAFASTDQKTCDGNANGQISTYVGSRENYRVWQHLANAGFITGTYNGTSVRPTSKLKGMSWELAYISENINYAGDGVLFNGSYGNSFSTNGYPSAIKIDEIWNIDTKLDDGKPATGKIVIANTVGISNCTDAVLSSTLTASYRAPSDWTEGCGMVLRQQF